MTHIDLNALDGSGSFTGYLATPAADNGNAGSAGIVVVQEIFGINAGIRAIADGWAAQGYTALAPDLFWRLQPGVELDADVPAQAEQAFALYKQFDPDKAVADIEVAIKTLRAHGCSKVGVVGYCLGGLLAYLSATRTDSDASVSYYGGGIDARLGEAAAIGKPLLMHIAGRDHFVPEAARAAITAALTPNRHVTVYTYDADHAFARHSGSARVPAMAEQADARTQAFFAEQLKPAA